jgi:hypothetical protein
MKTVLAWIYACSLAACALFATEFAHAVHVSPDGMGQILIFPYYTTRAVDGNAFNTYLSIASPYRSRALRVRLREGRSGTELAAFNLYLQLDQEWTATLVPGPSGSGARLITRDAACVSPAFTPSADGTSRYLDLAPQGSSAAALSAEGLVEVFNMGDGIGRLGNTCAEYAAAASGSAMDNPTDGAYGALTMINVASGVDFTVAATALADAASNSYYRPAADPYPDYASLEIRPVTGLTLNGKLYRVPASNPVAAVEAALAAPVLYNQVILDAATQSVTDWVVTMPTRRYHEHNIFTSPWFSTYSQVGGTINVEGFYSPRNAPVVPLQRDCFTLCPVGPVVVDLRLPYTSTVLGFAPSPDIRVKAAATPALGSMNGSVLTLPDSGILSLQPQRVLAPPSFQAGMTRIADGVTANEALQLAGLPLVGFMVRTLKNGTLSCNGATCIGNYSAALPHRVIHGSQPFRVSY